MTIKNLSEELSGCAYPGRGIVAGMSEDGKKAVSAYFIMGRSESSRNRVFVQDGEGIRTEAFVLGNNTIVTNGDQTDTVYDGLSEGKTFEESLRVRKYEHDAPNYTPRISSVLHIENNEYSYAMSILKSHNGNPDICERHTYTYDAAFAGEGHYIHTYMGDGNPLPSYEGEPTWVKISGDIEEFTQMIWDNLNADNIDIATGEYETRIINKNVK